MTSKKRKDATAPSQFPDSQPKKARQQNQTSPHSTLLGPHEQIIGELKSKYEVSAASVISSTQIRKRVTFTTQQLLNHTTPIVLLHARPADVCKLITIVEQSKRVMKGEGKPLFQYNQLFELPPETGKSDIVERTVLDSGVEDSEDDDDDDDGFEVMESRFEKAVLPQQTRATPMSMRVFLSVAAIPELKAKGDVTVQTTEVNKP